MNFKNNGITTYEYHANNGYWGTLRGHIIRIFLNVTDTCIFSLRTDNIYQLEDLERVVNTFPETIELIERRFKK